MKEQTATPEENEAKAKLLEGLPALALQWFRDNGIIFHGTGGKWEAVAFRLYSMMVDPDGTILEMELTPEGERIRDALAVIQTFRDEDTRHLGPNDVITRVQEILMAEGHQDPPSPLTKE